MSEHDQSDAIQALTDQRVRFTLGGDPYSARRGTLRDLGTLAKFTAERQSAGETTTLELDGELYMLCALMEPEHHLTPDELLDRLPPSAVYELPAILERLGFTPPQLPGSPSTGATSTPPSAS